jgi:predicted dehydrogenase
MMENPPLRVGILATGSHPIQTIYLPALHALPTLFSISAVYFSTQSQEPPVPVTANGTATKSTTKNPDTILSDPDINLILNFMPNEYHELYTIAALQAGKHVMVETPVSLSIPSARRIIEAEKDAPNGARVFVASARRYAPCFEDVFKKEVRSLERIHYARCRMIAGPHAAHTATKARVGAGAIEGEGRGPPFIKEPGEDRTKRLRGLLEEVFGKDEQPSQERMALSRFLASLGCHDLGIHWDTRMQSRISP